MYVSVGSIGNAQKKPSFCICENIWVSREIAQTSANATLFTHKPILLTFQIELDTISLAIGSLTAKCLLFLIDGVLVTRCSFHKVIETSEFIRRIVGFVGFVGRHLHAPA